MAEAIPSSLKQAAAVDAATPRMKVLLVIMVFAPMMMGRLLTRAVPWAAR